MTATITAPNSVQTIGDTTLYLADVNPTRAAEIVERVNAFYADFPKVAPMLADIRTDRSEFPLGTPSIAVTFPDVLTSPAPPYHIRLNPQKYATSVLAGDTLDSFMRGWFNVPIPAGTIEHELGHVIDMAATYWDGRTTHPMSFDAISDYFDAKSISGYAQSGPQEAFADAFAGWRLGYSYGNGNVHRGLERVIELVK